LNAKEIIERLERLKTEIDGAFEKGLIDFDAIVGELDVISEKLHEENAAIMAGSLPRHHSQSADSRASRMLANIADYR
jgi:hypothetical protein